MYYEEKEINGVMHYREEPDGKWIEMSKELLTIRDLNQEATIKELLPIVDIAELYYRGLATADDLGKALGLK